MAVIRSLFVEKLFGRYDYQLDLDVAEAGGLKIVTAPNGYGKSTLLGIIATTGAGDYAALARVGFRAIKLVLSDGTGLLVSRKTVPSEDQNAQIVLTFQLYLSDRQKAKQGAWETPPIAIDFGGDGEDEEVSPSVRARRLGLVRLSATQWVDRSSGEEFSSFDLLRHPSSLRRNAIRRTEPEWLKSFRQKFKVLFVTADRLKALRESPRHPGVSPISVVHHVANSIKKEINDLRLQYAEVGGRLERTFPMRVIRALSTKQKNKKTKDQQVEFLQLVESVFRKQAIFSDMGLLDSQDVALVPELRDEDLTSETLQVLFLYFQDLSEKLTPVYPSAQALDLFVGSLNGMFQNKVVELDPEKGFTVAPTATELADEVEAEDISHASIDLERLSSGEQHIVVLLYRLIFETSKGGVILLDEPEISLHPVWQEAFVDLLSKVSELKECQIVLATHSPTLVGDRWDDAIELGEL